MHRRYLSRCSGLPAARGVNEWTWSPAAIICARRRAITEGSAGAAASSSAAGAGASSPPIATPPDTAAAPPTPSPSSSPAAAADGAATDDSASSSSTRRRRRVRLHEPLAEQKDRTFRRGSSSFLAGFSSVSLVSLGCAFLFVPLYRLYCSPQGRGADPKFIADRAKRQQEEADGTVEPPRRKLLTVRFLSDVGNTMPIAFVPLQRTMEVLIGEPALAFYSAYNKSNRTLLGVSTYSISPAEGMAYLNKIQCFCFEEQRFKPHELVEMPVFFYIDKDFLNDPMISWLDEVILNYTFFNLEKTRDIVNAMSRTPK